jgi:hypothetical protein
VTATTYRKLIDVAFDGAGRASVAMSQTRFANQSEGREAVDAYEDLLAAIASHLDYLVGRTKVGSVAVGGRSVEPALAHARSVLAERGRRHPAPDHLGDLHPVARAWREAAAGLRAAADLLDTHRGPERQWRTPDAWLLDHPQQTAAALQPLADLTRAIAGSGHTLALRGREVMPGNVTFVELLNAAPLRIAAAGMREYARAHSETSTLDGMRLANATSVPAEAGLESAVHTVAALRQQAWEHTRDARVSIRTLREYAVAAVNIHQHAAAIVAAAATRYADLRPGQNNDAGAAALRNASDASRRSAAAWRAIHQRCEQLHSPVPAETGVHAQVEALGASLQAFTRSGNDWRPAQAIVPDAATAGRLLAEVHSLLSVVDEIAGWHQRLAEVLAANRQLYGPAVNFDRGDVSDDPRLAAARLARKLAPIPPRNVDALLDAYAAAVDTSRHATQACVDAGPYVSQHLAPPAPRGATQQDVLRWHGMLAELAPTAATDPHTPVLLAALTRVAQSGHDADAALRAITDRGPLRDAHPARTLHYRLLAVCDAAAFPSLDVPSGASHTTPAPASATDPRPSDVQRRPAEPMQRGRSR